MTRIGVVVLTLMTGLSGPTEAMQLRCDVPQHNAFGSPVFGKVPPGIAEYQFVGSCKGDDGQATATYRARGTWTPTESNAAKANASEVYEFNLFRTLALDAPNGSRVRTFAFIIGARCDRDPWLYSNARCTAVGNNIPDEVKQAWPEVTAARFPRSRVAIGAAEQRRLRAMYAQANPGVATTPPEALRPEAVRRTATPFDASRISVGPKVGGETAVSKAAVEMSPRSNEELNRAALKTPRPDAAVVSSQPLVPKNPTPASTSTSPSRSSNPPQSSTISQPPSAFSR